MPARREKPETDREGGGARDGGGGGVLSASPWQLCVFVSARESDKQ